MNNSSLPPDLGDRSEPAVEADRAADAARATDTVHATETAQAPPFAQPASGKEYSHPTAAGTARSADMAPSLKPRRRVWPFALAGFAAALLIVGIVPRLHASAALTQQTQAQSVLSVSVVAPRPAPAVNELLLPGAVTPFAKHRSTRARAATSRTGTPTSASR